MDQINTDKQTLKGQRQSKRELNREMDKDSDNAIEEEETETVTRGTEIGDRDRAGSGPEREKDKGLEGPGKEEEIWRDRAKDKTKLH